MILSFPPQTMQAKVKPADTSRASTTTLADDPDLVISLVPGTYLIGVTAVFSDGNAAPGSKFKLAFSSSYTFATGFFQAGTDGTTSAAYRSYPNAVDADLFAGNLSFGTADTFYQGTGTLLVTAPGNLTVQWAQAASSVNATKFKAGSSLYAQRVG